MSFKYTSINRSQEWAQDGSKRLDVSPGETFKTRGQKAEVNKGDIKSADGSSVGFYTDTDDCVVVKARLPGDGRPLCPVNRVFINDPPPHQVEGCGALASLPQT